jgi:hypothetical protein
MAVLGRHAARQAQLASKNLFQSVVARDPPPDFTDSNARYQKQLFQNICRLEYGLRDATERQLSLM